MAQEIMQVLVNQQRIPFPIWIKSTSLGQNCCKISQAIVVTSLYVFFFDVKKKRPKTDHLKSYQCSASIDVSHDLKVGFSLVT